MMQKIITALLILCLAPICAQTASVQTGPAITEYGMVAKVPGMEPLPKDAQFKVSFDVSRQAKTATVNRSIESAARFINMHAAAGVKPENVELAMVIHGSAVKDMTADAFYQQATSGQNANAALIKVLQENGVKFYVCGQSAAYHGVKHTDLLPGVKMALSAMTAHALLQQQGYTLNPF